MRDALIVSVLSVVPRSWLARAMGRVARWGPSRWFTAAFVRAYGVDLSEAEVPEGGFRSLDTFFTRRLVPGARPVDARDGVVVSPVDGTCAFVGTVDDDRVPVAPGRSVSLSALVGERRERAFDVVVLYLSPRDYHRVHAPLEGRLTAFRYLPGTLWPVFPAAVRRIDGLFARNERIALRLQTAHGVVDVVMVGAFGVGRMSVLGVPCEANTGAPAADGPMDREVVRGGEVGCFHLGSTVVLAMPTGTWTWGVAAGQPVRMGTALGHLA